MLRMCGTIFGTGKALILDSLFCVTKGITEIEAKCVYVRDLTKKRHYWPKGVSGDFIDTHFQGKEVGDVGMLEAINQDNNSFQIFCMKEPDYVMNIMVSWMTLRELEGAKTRRDFIDSSGM